MRRSFPSGADGAALWSNRDIAILILPLVVEQILSISLGFVDVVMVASLGEGAVSAVSLVDSINILIIGVFNALATGGAVVCAHYFGSRNAAMISNTAKQLIYTTLAISLFISIIGIIIQHYILTLVFGSIETHVMRDAKIYFFYSLLSYPLIALYNAIAALFRAQGNSFISMSAALMVNVMNIGGNALCIYALGWGVEGVAIPTLVARGIAAFFLLALLYRARAYKNKPAIVITGLTNIKLDVKIIHKILAIGIPNGIENSVFQIGKILVLTLVTGFGTSAVAANAAANKLSELSCIPGSAMALAMLTVIGQALGARRPIEAMRLCRKLLIISYAALAAATLPLVIWVREITALFNLQSGTAELACKMFLFHAVIAALIWPLSFVLPAALRAANNARFTMLVSITSVWIVRVGLSYVFALWTGAGAMALWYAMGCDWVVRSILFILRWKRGSWKEHYELV